MVGAIKVGGLRQRLARAISHDSEDFPERKASHDSYQSIRRHVPFIASPLDPKTTEWLKNKHQQSNLTLKRRPTVAQTEANRIAGGIFRKQHEASPLELFFDLFFVANLAVFTYNNSQATPQALASYIGFFSLMWSFWFQVSIFDVRFYVDSILNRFFKMSQFAIFVSFTGLDSIYSAISNGGTTRAFHGLALVFMVSRLILVVQHAIVLWYVRPLKRTVLPLTLLMLVYLLSAMAFLGTRLENGGRTLDGPAGRIHVIIWYCICGVEAVLVMLISSIWRILSFKHTHLVERVGLLTLIIMGEGIIGAIKAIASVLSGTSVTVWSAAGRVVSGVFLIYLIFVLYFTPIAHDRFGTIRQQIWALLHYPLHVAILLAEEGAAETMIWNTVISARQRLIGALPSLAEPSNGFDTVDAMVTRINNTMTDTAKIYDYIKLKDVYDWKPDLDQIKNISSSYGYASPRFNVESTEIIGDMVNKTTNFLFKNFKFSGPKYITKLTDANEILGVYYKSYTIAFTSFYACAGGLLVTLAFMYWFGKNRKTWEDYISIAARLVVGIALPFISILGYTQSWEVGYMFDGAGWIVSVVVFAYLVVVIIDNVVQNIYDKWYIKKIEAGEVDLESLNEHRANSAFGPSAVPESHRASQADLHAQVHGIEKGSPKNKTLRFEEMERQDSGSSHELEERTALYSEEPQQFTHEDRRESDAPLTQNADNSGYLSPPQNQGRYSLPPVGFNNQGYGQIDTTYQGSGAYEDDHHRTDLSFEEERMMSPATYRDAPIDRPQEGHHPPEQQREH